MGERDWIMQSLRVAKTPFLDRFDRIFRRMNLKESNSTRGGD